MSADILTGSPVNDIFIGELPRRVPFPAGPVRTGYRNYTIEAWHGRESRSFGDQGQTNNLLGTIRIDESELLHDPREAANTLLHELLHVAWKVGALEAEDKQERIVTVLANQLCQMWRDNPKVIAWLDQELKERGR